MNAPTDVAKSGASREALDCAVQSARLALSDLQAANKRATPMESLLLLDLITQQHAIIGRLSAMLNTYPEF